MATHLNLVVPIQSTENRAANYTAINKADTEVADGNKAAYVKQTLAGELLRIKAYIAEIGREAAFLKLKAANVYISETSTLALIAEAMLSIVKNSASDASGAIIYEEDGTTIKTKKVGETNVPIGYLKDTTKEELTLDAGDITVLPAGYYTSDVTIKTTSLENQSEGSATALDILKGKDAWVNGSKIPGALDTDLSGKKAGNTAYKEDSDKLVIYLNEDSEDAENNRIVLTGIKYVTANEVTNKVTIKKVTKAEGDDNNEAAWTAESVEIPAGYYPEAISIPVRVESDDTADGEEKVLNVTSLTISKPNFDTKETLIYKPQLTNFDYYTLVTIGKAKTSYDSTTGKSSVTSEGWIAEGDIFAGLNIGAYTTTGVTITNTAAKNAEGIEGQEGYIAAVPASGSITINKKTHGYTPDSITIPLPITANPLDTTATTTYDKDHSKATTSATITINPGYHTAGKITVTGEVDLTDSKLAGTHELTIDTPANDAAKAKYTETITSQYITDDLQAGYFATSDTKKYKILDAKITTLPTVINATTAEDHKAKLIIPVSTKGWFEGATYTLELSQVKTIVDSLTTVELVTYSTKNTVVLNDVEGAVVTAKDGSYYNKVDMSTLLTEMAAV